MQQEQRPRIQFDGEQSLQLESPHWINEGVLLEEIELQLPQGFTRSSGRSPRLLRNQLAQLRCRLDRDYLTTLIGRTLAGGGLSDLQVRTQQARVEISGLLSREGRRTPFLARGFLFESAGPHGGAVFYDLRLFGRPGLPAPALISLLTARTGRHGPIHVKGAVTLEFDILSLLFKYGLATAGWKIPSYRDIGLKQLEIIEDTICLSYNGQDTPNQLPLAQRDPAYPYWTELWQSQQTFLKAEEWIGKGDYKSALQAYSDELWRHPGHPFLQERLMQLYIATNHQENWNKAYHIAEELLQNSRQSQAALNCLAQYFEGVQDYQTAAHYYTKMGEFARAKQEHVEAALSFGKAAELLEVLDVGRARSLWQMAREEDRGYRPAIAALARHALKTGSYEEAEEILSDLITQTPPSIERARYHLSLAGLYRSRLRDLTNARTQLDLASPYLGEDIAYLRELAEFRLATDENIDALRTLDRLTERVKLLNQPALHADLLFRTGQILEERLGRPGQALTRYHEALHIRVDHPHSRNRVATLEASRIQPEPIHAGVFDDLQLLIEEKIRTIESGQHQPNEEAKLRLELARLYWQHKQPDEAFEQGRLSLKLQSSLEEAWELLEEIGVQTSRQAELASIHRELAKSALFPHDALQHFENALRLAPSDTETLKHLTEQYQKLEQWDKLDTLFNRWIETASTEETPALLLQRAQNQETKLQQLDAAERSYVQAFQVSTDIGVYTEELINFYIRNDLWDKLGRQIDHLAQPLEQEQQAKLYGTKGKLLLQANREAQALSAYQKALLLSPHDPELLQPTIELLRKNNNFAALVPFLKTIAEKSNESDELDYRLELATLLDQRLGEPKQALEQYQRVIALAPTHLQALQRLALLSKQFNETSQAIEAYTKLIDLPENQPSVITEYYEQLILLNEEAGYQRATLRTLEQLLQHQPEYAREPNLDAPFGSDTPDTHQALILYQLGTAHERPGLLLMGSELLQEKHPKLAQMCIDEGLRFSPLAPNLWEAQFKDSNDEERKSLWQKLENAATQDRLSPSQSKQLNDIFEQVDLYGLPLEEVQGVFESFQSKQLFLPTLSSTYATMLEHQDKLEQALDVRRQLLEQMPASPEKTNLRFEMAIQQIRVLNDRENGLEQLWMLLSEEPDHKDAFYELQQLYEEEDQLTEFIDKLQSLALDANPGPSRADLCIQVFELYKDFLADEDKAQSFLSAVIESKDDPVTFQMIAVAYESSGSFSEAAELYTRIASNTGLDESVQALERAGEIYKRELDEPDRAIDLFMQIMDMDPGHQGAIEQLKEVYETLWMWDEYARLLEREADQLNEPTEAAEKYFEMGEIYLGRLQDYESALDLFRRSLRNNPRSTKVLSSLQALYEEFENWPAVLAALKALTRNEADPARLCDLHVQIAQTTLNRLEKPQEAENHFQLAHTQQPERIEPLDGLVQLYETTENNQELVKAAAQVAVVSAKHNDKSKAKDALKRLISAVERTPGALGPEALLRNILQERQESARLTRRVFDILSEIATSGTLSPTFFLAQELYSQQLLELSWLLRVWDAEGEVLTEEQADALIDHAQIQDWDALHQTLVRLAEDAEHIEDTAIYELGMAELALHKRNAPEDAKVHAQKALQLGAPPERAMLILEHLQLQEKGYIELTPLLQLAKELTHPDELGRVLFHLGSRLLLHHQNWHDSLQCLLEATILSGSATQLGNTKRILNELGKAVQEGNPPLTLPEDLPPVGRSLLNAWLSFTSNNTQKAAQYLEEAITIAPNTSAALRLLGHYYINEGANPERALNCFYRYLEAEWEHLPFDEVVEVCLLLAGLYSNTEGGAESALFYLEQANKFMPEDERIFTAQTQIMKQAAMWGHLQSLYESHIESPEPTDNLAELWFHLGQLHAVHLQNPEEAQLCYQKALQADPLHTASLQELEELNQASSRSFDV